MPHFVYQDSDGVDKTLEIGQDPVLIGRAAGCHILSNDARVSRQHAKIFFEGGHYWIEDLGSANGVFVNGTQHAQAELTNGDTLQVGDALFVFHASA